MGSSPSKEPKKGEKRPDDYCRVQLSKLQALVSRDLKLLDWYFFHRKRTQGKYHHSKNRTIYGTFLNLQMLFLSSLYFNPGIKKLWTQGFDYLTLPDTYLMRMIASMHRSEFARVRTSHPLLQENISFTFLSYIFGQFRFMIDFDTLRKVPKIFKIISGTWMCSSMKCKNIIGSVRARSTRLYLESFTHISQSLTELTFRAKHNFRTRTTRSRTQVQELSSSRLFSFS